MINSLQRLLRASLFVVIFLFGALAPVFAEARSVVDIKPPVKCEDGPCDVAVLVRDCTMPEGAEVEVFGDIAPSGDLIPPDYENPNTGTYLYSRGGFFNEKGSLYSGDEKILISEKKINVLRMTSPLYVRGKIHYCGNKICALTDIKISEGERNNPVHSAEVPICSKQVLINHACEDKRCESGKCTITGRRYCSYWECDKQLGDQLPSALKACAVDSDCVEVRANCCCTFEAINRKKMEEYNILHDELCKLVKEDCDCKRLFKKPVCQNGTCGLQ